MEDGWKKYRMMLYAGANMEYTDSEGNIRIIETEPVLLDIYDEVIKPYILGDLSTLGSFQITEGEETPELIRNFNDNMEHIKISFKETLMIGEKGKLKFRWILCFIIFSLVLLIYGNHLFKERAKKLEDMRKKESLEFMKDGWKKYRMMLYAGANMEYTDSEGNIRVIETEPVLLDIYDETIDPYILGKTPSLGSFRITEGEETLELIQNFNDNMSHLKIWNNREGRYMTISENEGLEEFKDINSFEELWEYMNKRNDEGVIYINELDIVGYDRTAQDAKFIYDYGNGKIKELSINRISLVNLFGLLKEEYRE